MVEESVGWILGVVKDNNVATACVLVGGLLVLFLVRGGARRLSRSVTGQSRRIDDVAAPLWASLSGPERHELSVLASMKSMPNKGAIKAVHRKAGAFVSKSGDHVEINEAFVPWIEDAVSPKSVKLERRLRLFVVSLIAVAILIAAMWPGADRVERHRLLVVEGPTESRDSEVLTFGGTRFVLFPPDGRGTKFELRPLLRTANRESAKRTDTARQVGRDHYVFTLGSTQDVDVGNRRFRVKLDEISRTDPPVTQYGQVSMAFTSRELEWAGRELTRSILRRGGPYSP